MHRLCVIVPAYNEAPRVLQRTLESLMHCTWRVAVVDDGSATPVAEALDGGFLKEAGEKLVILRHCLNLGQGAALQTGMDYAERAGAEAVLHFDADGQHDIADIPSFVAALDKGFDVALGSRFLHAEDIAAIPWKRRMLLRVARLVDGLATGLWLTDAHNGFRMLNRRAFTAIRMNGNRMSHASEILWLIRKHRLTYSEVPTHITYSGYSAAKGQRAGNALNILLELLADRLL